MIIIDITISEVRDWININLLRNFNVNSILIFKNDKYFHQCFCLRSVYMIKFATNIVYVFYNHFA